MPYGIQMPPGRKKRDRFDPTDMPDFGPEASYPESQALTALREHLSATPQRQDYQQSTLGKIAAALVGGATGMTKGADVGVAAGREVMDRPFTQAMQDFSQRGHDLGVASELEGREGERAFRTAQESRRGREAAFDRSLSMRRLEGDETAEDRLERMFAEGNADRDADRLERAGDRKAALEERRADRAETARYHSGMLAKDRADRIGPEKILPPDSQRDAEEYALDRILRDYPEYEKFTKKDAKGFPMITRKTPRGGLFGMVGMKREQTPEESAEFDEFLNLVDEEREAILQNRADPYSRIRKPTPGVGAPPKVDYRDVFGGGR